MIQRLTGQLPYWARAQHPIMRYELAKARQVPKRVQYFRALWVIILAFLLVGAGYLIATGFLQRAAGHSLWESALNIVFWPLLVVQIMMSVIALAYTGSTVSEELRRQTWDNLRATEGGAELAIRARWISVFYRTRGLLTVLTLIRAGLIVGILLDLTAFQGRYLDLLIDSITPEVALPVAALLLAFMMTASLLLPFTALGFDAAVGLLMATIFQQRIYAVIAQALYVILRIVLVIGLAFSATQFLTGSLTTTDGGAWLLLGGFAALGDWGLSFLNLGFFGELWSTIPFGICLGLALLLFSLAQAWLTDWLIGLAIRQAQVRG